MPGYGNTWSNDIPLGSEQAKTIDNIIRQLRLDIQERMSDLVVDWYADPVVLSGIEDSETDQFIMIAFPAFISIDTNYDNAHADVNNSNDPIVANIPLKVGNRITLVEFLVNKDTATSVQGFMFWRPFAAGGVVDDLKNLIGQTPILSSGGVSIIATSPLDYTINIDEIPWLQMIGGGSGDYRIYGARVTYRNV